jgi:hypothetical protein
METTTEKRHEMCVMDRTGDTKTMWSKSNPDEVEIARDTFRKFKDKGYAAFSVKGKDGERGEQMHEFDPDAERIIFVPALQGG